MRQQGKSNCLFSQGRPRVEVASNPKKTMPSIISNVRHFCVFLHSLARRAAREEEGATQPVVQPARGRRGRHLHLQQHRAAVAQAVLAGEDRRRVLGHVQEDEGRLLVLRRDAPGRDLAGKRRGEEGLGSGGWANLVFWLTCHES